MLGPLEPRRRGHRRVNLDYGPAPFGDRSLGLEHWIEDIVPKAVRAASEEDSGGRPVQLVGWCLGEILALLAQWADPPRPRRSARPTGQARLRARRIRQVRDEALDHRDQPPRPSCSRRSRRWTSSWTTCTHTPGRSFGQLYHRFFRSDDLAKGTRALNDRTAARAGAGRPEGSLLPMRRLLAIALLALVAAGVAASAAAAQAPPEEPRIRAWVTVSGVDVGGLTLAEAEAKLEQTLAPLLARDVVVTVARRAFPLTMAEIGLRFRADRTAKRAFDAGQAAPPAADGSLPPASAAPAVSFERAPLWQFAKRTAAAVKVKRRDARLRITLTTMIKRKGRKGRTLEIGK